MSPDAVDQFDARPSFLASGCVLQGRYRIVRPLGRGGMGAVYEAIDQRLEATVAIKETFSNDDRLRRQFEQEARLLARLQHPALPRVSDYFTEGDRAFLVMQFISGADLAEIISRQPGPLPSEQVIAWADQLLDALIYLHTRDRQIIHRDIKPHNLKLNGSGQIALLDFGLAKAQPGEASTASSSASIFGYTRRYSPLEQIQNQGTTPQSDIYALGATLYHLLTGIKPPDALARAAALANSKPDPLRPANEIYRGIGPEMSAVLSRALALSAENRYATAVDFRDALRRAGKDGTLVVRKNGVPLPAESSNSVTMNTTVVRKRRTLTVDPFDSYSILKPDEGDWLLPKPSRRPAVIVALVSLMIMVGVGTVYDFGHLIDNGGSVLDSARLTVGEPVAHQGRSDKPRPNAAAVGSVSMLSTADASRRLEKQRHPSRHPTTSTSPLRSGVRGH